MCHIEMLAKTHQGHLAVHFKLINTSMTKLITCGYLAKSLNFIIGCAIRLASCETIINIEGPSKSLYHNRLLATEITKLRFNRNRIGVTARVLY